MNTKSLFVDVQGFKSLNNEFIVKEFALCTSEYTQVFLIKPPYTFSRLSQDEKKRVLWLEKNHGILWREGYVDPREFRRMIVNHLNNQTIFVKGSEKIQWINDLCANCTVIDLGEHDCPNFLHLYEKYCNKTSAYNCIHHKNKCALKNVICLKKWYFDSSTVCSDPRKYGR
jgi:hypothetical protein